MTFLFSVGAVFGTDFATTDDIAHLKGHVGPEIVLSHRAVYVSLTGMTR